MTTREPSVLDVAWIVPDTANLVHQVELLTGRLVCADWVTVGAGVRIPDEQAEIIGQWCEHCWPDKSEEAKL